ncbi:DUF3108 domain-containing protein [Candidatus Nitrotoga sp. AM1P]|uniref:DUF3108 domain-containing protein n=1 Tax=Candidatus Nitrotoga sp. AM1P TaxID=2559597 RepID=UPI0010B35F0E|nr:DUF3108 domain-containing protein [Candidatus Nitrotoga sp. AM1P]BBJ23586.1 hypothetical protein W01_15130 [Candidatus Nitrotoga sp. AM1P]
MNSGTPTSRITLAIALSVLLHSAALWLFQVELPNSEALLPPLTAKLEAIPLQADVPTPEVEPASPPTETDSTVTPLPEPEPESIPVAEASSAVAATPEPESIPATEAASAVAAIPEPESMPAIEAASAVAITPKPASIPATEAASVVAAVSEPASIPAIETASAVAKVGEPVAHPLPKHAQLKFAVYLGQDHFQIGEITHRLEIIEDKYILKGETQTTGLARLFKSYQLMQTSHGKAGNFGLQPEGYEEEQNVSSGKQKTNAAFNWAGNKLHFSHGGETELPSGAQDILSFLYQLSQLPLHNEILSIAITTGKKLEKYELEIGAEEEVITQMGKLRALPLRRLHSEGGDGMEVWLGLEYRLLPIKFRQIKGSGEMILEVVISDIRVADE